MQIISGYRELQGYRELPGFRKSQDSGNSRKSIVGPPKNESNA